MAETGLPFLPGTATVSEVLAVLEAGFTEMKFFPAEPSGGAAYLKAIASPVPAARFCPTGGITAASAAAYLSLPHVGCVGGSWLTPAEALATGDWSRVEQLAREAAVLRRPLADPSEDLLTGHRGNRTIMPSRRSSGRGRRAGTPGRGQRHRPPRL